MYQIQEEKKDTVLGENEKKEVKVCHDWGLFFIIDYSCFQKEEVDVFSDSF